MTGVTPEIAKIIGFPKVTPEDVTRISAQQNEHIERITAKTLRDWPWDQELGKPHGFNAENVQENVNDLARYKDMVNHPPHYTSHPSGVECIAVIEHMPYCRGAAIKYIWRAGKKQNEIQDLEKAKWCIEREIARLKATVTQDSNDAGC